MVQYRAKILNVMLDCISLEVELDSGFFAAAGWVFVETPYAAKMYYPH